MLAMAVWRIVGVRSIDPTSRPDTAKTASVKIERAGASREILVDFPDTAEAAGRVFKPRQAVREFLTWSDPPTLVIDSTEGPIAAHA